MVPGEHANPDLAAAQDVRKGPYARRGDEACLPSGRTCRVGRNRGVSERRRHRALLWGGELLGKQTKGRRVTDSPTTVLAGTGSPSSARAQSYAYVGGEMSEEASASVAKVPARYHPQRFVPDVPEHSAQERQEEERASNH